MRTIRLFLLIGLSLLSLISNSQEIGFPIIHNYTPKDYNNAPQVWSIVQDNRGIMYFGVRAGIMEYDGVSWRYISNEKQALSYAAEKDKSGKIYIAANGDFGYLKIDDKGNTVYKSLTPLIKDTSLELGIVWSVRHTSKFIYFLTYDAILQYTPLQENLQIFKADTNGRFLGDFVFQDTYYARLARKGLMKVENNELIPTHQSDFFKTKNSFNIALPYDSTTLLIPTRTEGLYLYQPSKNTPPRVFPHSELDFFTDNGIYSALSFQKEYFILGSLKKGALLLNKSGKSLQQYQSNLLQNDQIWSIATDTSQNIWFGLDNGISKTEHSQDLSYWNKNVGLKGSVQSIIRFHDTIFIATSTSVYFIDKKSQPQNIKNIPAGQNWCFLVVNNGKSLLVGTSEGIYELKGRKAELVYNSSHIFKIYQSIKNPNRLIAANYPFLTSLVYKNGKWIPEGQWDGVKDDIRGIIEDDNGEVWLGTLQKGVIRVTPNYDNITKPKKIRCYNTKDGFSSLLDILPYRFKNKVIWGTGEGLKYYNSRTDHFEPFDELGKRFCDGSSDVYIAKEMPDGKIWICPGYNQKADIGYLLPKSTGGYDWVYAPFRRIPEMSLSTLLIEPSGIVWIGGSEGLYRYDMSKDTKDYNQKFNCLIRKVVVGTDSLLYGGSAYDTTLAGLHSATLEYRFNSLQFEVAAPFFDQEEKTLYSHKLIGYDKEWSEWNRETRKEYTNLREGTYTFQIKARNIYDVVSQISTYQITILPPWHRTFWAYILYVIASMSFIWLIININSRRLKAANIHLENIIKERTHEIAQKNISLELQKQKIQAHDEELETFNEELKVTNEELFYQREEILAQNEKLKKMDEFKQGMTSMIVHDLKNPLNSIINIPKSISPEKQVVIMQQWGKQMLNMVLNILDVHKYEEVKMHLLLKERQFALIALNSIQQIQFLLEQKEVTVINEIEPELVAKVDEEVIERVMVNLLTNAIKFTPVGENIVISSDRLSEEIVRISVTDKGDGIAEDKAHLVFQKFGQIIAKKSGGVRSTGLGLSFCKLAVEAHGGEIGFNSTAGIGTSFWFTLRLGKVENIKIKPIAKSEEFEKKLIPFTEEEKRVLEPIINQLKGFTIYETDDIEEILTVLNQSESENIQNWVSQIKKNIINLNQIRFLELLQIS